MVLEEVTLIHDMNKLINDADVVNDFALVDRNSVPSLLLVFATRECFTSMEEVDRS